MHPVLFRIPLGGMFSLSALPIYSYGVMLGLSLIVGWYLTLGLAEREGLPKEKMATNYIVTALSAIAGSRILYVLTNLDEFDSLGSMLAMRRGGLVAYGGFLGGFLGSWLYMRKHRLPLLVWGDVAVPSLASGLMITRIGCYLFGCDFGRPLSPSAPGWLQKLGTFPHWAEGTLEHGQGSPAWVQHVKERGLAPTAEASLPVHPTQLYESLVGLALLVVLLGARRSQRFRGQLLLLFTFAYGAARFGLEILRDDAERGSIPPALPQHVLVPLCLGLFALGYLAAFSRAISSIPLRRLTQVVAFGPALLAYLALRPEAFAAVEPVQLSTSQFVALFTGLVACAAFAMLFEAALRHPARAMAVLLPSEGDASLATPAPAEGPSEAAKVSLAEDARAKEPAASASEEPEASP